MLIYLIIAAEFAILYAVYWYVYVRDPKPNRVFGNLWGRYGENAFTTGGIDPTCPIVADYDAGGMRTYNEVVPWWQDRDPHEPYPDHVAYTPAEKREEAQFWRIKSGQQPIRPEHRDEPGDAGSDEHPITRVLDRLARTLDSLNVKTP